MIDEATLDKWNSMAEDLESYGVTHSFFPNLNAGVAAIAMGRVIVPALVAEVRWLQTVEAALRDCSDVTNEMLQDEREHNAALERRIAELEANDG